MAFQSSSIKWWELGIFQGKRDLVNTVANLAIAGCCVLIFNQPVARGCGEGSRLTGKMVKWLALGGTYQSEVICP